MPDRWLSGPVQQPQTHHSHAARKLTSDYRRLNVTFSTITWNQLPLNFFN